MTMPMPDAVAAAVLADARLPAEFAALCDCGGRLSGTESEHAALTLVKSWGQAATGRAPEVVAAPYGGWRAVSSSLHLMEAGRQVPLACLPLVRSSGTGPGGIEAEVVRVGRGAAEEFESCKDALRGRFALVRHEYMFAAGHIHRRLKYPAAVAAGAVGFLIAGPLPTGVVAGSSGRGTEPGIPAFGISPEAAARLSPPQGMARVRAELLTEEFGASTENHPLRHARRRRRMGGVERPCRRARACGKRDGQRDRCRRRTRRRACPGPPCRAFPARASTRDIQREEWALTGSKVYLAGLPPEERGQIALNVNLDSVGGAGSLTALCSGFPALGTWVRQVSAAAGLPVSVHLPLMSNSDHANFAAHGIPALRLVAGFDDPASNLRHVLTAADTRTRSPKPSCAWQPWPRQR